MPTRLECKNCGREFEGKTYRVILCGSCYNYDSVKGQHKHPLFSLYNAMIQRCYNPARNVYHCYGAKGIKVSDRWLDFAKFLEDVGERPEGTTLDRVDNTKGYSPENCRWVTIQEQRLNRRRFKSAKHRYKGVAPYWNKWKATLRINSENVYLGLFGSEESAANAVNAKLVEMYKERCLLQYLNPVGEVYENLKNKQNSA